MRSSNIKIWLSNTRWVAYLHSTSLARPPHWPEDEVKVNKFIWTYSSATENVFYQSCFRTANIRGIFCLSYPFPPYISQTVIFFADLHRYVNSENWGVDQTTSLFFILVIVREGIMNRSAVLVKGLKLYNEDYQKYA